MSAAFPANNAGGARCDDEGAAAAPGIAKWLRLAAAPTFATMALLTASDGSAMICSAVSDASPLTGMVPMYLLMSAFHLPPWLKLATRGGARRRRSSRS